MRYVPALDGLRGIAIASVVAYHAFGWPAGGWIGVHIFFVLSGFLITTLLLEERTIRFGAFYARRARRLLPSLALVLVAYLLLGGTLGAVAHYGFYTGNVYAAFVPGATHRIVGLNQLWSLAQEEQFYLVWPAALLLARRARRPELVLLTIVAALMVYRCVLTDAGASDARVYFAPDTNVDGLLLGAALAFRPMHVGRRAIRCAAIALAPVLAIIPSVASTDAVVLPVVEVAAAILVAAAVCGTLELPRPLVWLGGISYSLYLWHGVVLWRLHGHHALAAVALSVAAAYASTRWIERPIRSRRRRPRGRQSPRAAADAA